MRSSIIAAAFVSAFMISGAYAQTTSITGTQQFCAVQASKANCSFDTAAACENGIANMGADGTASYRCSERSELNVNQ